MTEEFKLKYTECPYSEVCCEVEKCKSCLNNKKRSYYVPESISPYYPYYPTMDIPYCSMTVATRG